MGGGKKGIFSAIWSAGRLEGAWTSVQSLVTRRVGSDIMTSSLSFLGYWAFTYSFIWEVHLRNMFSLMSIFLSKNMMRLGLDQTADCLTEQCLAWWCLAESHCVLTDQQERISGNWLFTLKMQIRIVFPGGIQQPSRNQVATQGLRNVSLSQWYSGISAPDHLSSLKIYPGQSYLDVTSLWC